MSAAKPQREDMVYGQKNGRHAGTKILVCTGRLRHIQTARYQPFYTDVGAQKRKRPRAMARQF